MSYHSSKMKLEFLLSSDSPSGRSSSSGGGSSGGSRRPTSSSSHGHSSHSSHAHAAHGGSAGGHGHHHRSPHSIQAPAAAAPARQKTHKCHCGRAFNKREHLKRHKLLVHEEQRPFECTTCDLRFGTKQNMQVHLTTRKHKQRVSFLAPHGNPPM